MKETILTFSCKIATNEYLMNCKEHIYNHFFLKNGRNVFLSKVIKSKRITGLITRLRSATLNLDNRQSVFCSHFFFYIPQFLSQNIDTIDIFRL